MVNLYLTALIIPFLCTNCIYAPGEEVTKPPKRQEVLQWPAKNGKKERNIGDGFYEHTDIPRLEAGKDSFRDVKLHSRGNQRHIVVHSSSETNYGAVCPSKETGQFPYIPDCRKFINCWKGRGFIQACSPGTLFNPGSLECDFPAKVKCLKDEDMEEPDYVDKGMIDVRLGPEERDSSKITPLSTDKPSPWLQSPTIAPPNSRSLSNQPAYANVSPSPWLQAPREEKQLFPVITFNNGDVRHSSQPPQSYSSPWIPITTNGQKPTQPHLSYKHSQHLSPQLYAPQRYPLQQYPSQQNPSQQYPSQQLNPSKQPPSQQNPSQQNPSQQYPPQQYPFYQHTFQQRNPSQQNPSQQYPSQQYPSQQNPSQQNPSQQYPFQQYLPHQNPSQQYPPQQNPLQYPVTPKGYTQIPRVTVEPVQDVTWKQKSDCPMPSGTGLVAHPSDCGKFLNCWKGKAYTQSCGTGTLFNRRTLQCDHAHKVACNENIPTSRRVPDPAPGKKWPVNTHQSVQQFPTTSTESTYISSTTSRWIWLTTSHGPPLEARPSTTNDELPFLQNASQVMRFYDAGTQSWKTMVIGSSLTTSVLLTTKPTSMTSILPTIKPTTTMPTTTKPTTTKPTTTMPPTTKPTTSIPHSTTKPTTSIPPSTKPIIYRARTLKPFTPSVITPKSGNSIHSTTQYIITSTPKTQFFKYLTPKLPTSKPHTNIMSIPQVNTTRHIHPKNATKVGYSPNQMTSGQVLRLRGGQGPFEGYVEIQGSNPGWGLVCDQQNEWTITEATVVCRQLGYVRGAELSWQGRPIRPTDDTIKVSIASVHCTGNEASLQTCRIKPESEGCIIARDAAGVRCYRNHASQCRPDEINHDNTCYRLIVPTEENAEQAFSHGEALADCQKRKAKLLDINSQAENDFISEWLLQMYPHVNSVITSGVGVPIMGRAIWIWEGSGETVSFHKWWAGWTGNNLTQINKPGERMQCIVAKRVYPCMAPYLPDVTGVANMCEANYFYWDTEDCSLTHDHPYVCERPIDDVGCISGDGLDYDGYANVSSTGKACIAWDSPIIPSSFKYRVSDQVKATSLSGHNHCRNVDTGEGQPWCYVGTQGAYEYCDLPLCVNTGVEKAIASSTYKCSSKEFECRPKECILLTWACDGEADCSNGKDERDCSNHLEQFKKYPSKHLVKHKVEKWLQTSANTCAMRCLEAKAITCRSFNHHVEDQACFLSDSNIGLSGHLDENEAWDYYELEATALQCQNMFKCDNGKCVNKTMICDGKNNCGDRSDENDCSVKYLDYEIRLGGSDVSHEGRVEVKVFGQWGNICDDLFGLRDAEVVCRELGFNLGASQFVSHSSNGLNPIYLVDDLRCRGNETTIRDCEFDGWGVHDCGPEEIVGVTCRVPGLDCAENYWRCDTSQECIPVGFLCDNVEDCDDSSDESIEHCESSVELRLVDGPNSMSGRVEVRYHSIWGTLCDDDFSNNAAQVICRSLGFEGPAEAKKNAAFGPGEGQIWLDQLLCLGNETRIEDCRHAKWGENNCAHEEDAAVVCSVGKLNTDRRVLHSKPKPIEGTSLKYTSSTDKDILPSHCGLQVEDFLEFESDRVSRVLSGKEVPKGSFPWQASVRVKTAGKSVHWCGAVVISPLHILTAGHCLMDYMKAAYFIRAGDFDTEVMDDTEQEVNIEEIYIHEDFNKGPRLNNDIALVKLKPGGLRLGPSIQPICLPPVTARYNAGMNCSISGWGSVKSAGSGYSRTLRAAYVPILPNDTCIASFVYGPKSISEGMFCAGHLDGGSDSCQGDSGGPLICLANGRFTLYGITSWGHGCGRINKPGVYSRVGYYRSWIDKKLVESMNEK